MRVRDTKFATTSYLARNLGHSVTKREYDKNSGARTDWWSTGHVDTHYGIVGVEHGEHTHREKTDGYSSVKFIYRKVAYRRTWSKAFTLRGLVIKARQFAAEIAGAR